MKKQKFNTMKKQDLIDADKWFYLHDIPSTIVESNLFIGAGADGEFELSDDEILYRAKEFRRLKEQNLIKDEYKHICI